MAMLTSAVTVSRTAVTRERLGQGQCGGEDTTLKPWMAAASCKETEQEPSQVCGALQLETAWRLTSGHVQGQEGPLEKQEPETVSRTRPQTWPGAILGAGGHVTWPLAAVAAGTEAGGRRGLAQGLEEAVPREWLGEQGFWLLPTHSGGEPCWNPHSGRQQEVAGLGSGVRGWVQCCPSMFWVPSSS